jgi:phosphonate transport system ATP-binding protein
MFEFRNVTRQFGKKIAVDNVTLDIPAGQMVGIIGRSGAGKSTFLRMINRLADPTSGTIRFGDRDVSRLSGSELRRWHRDCAMIFQQFNLVPRLDVLTNVCSAGSTIARRSSILKMFSRRRDHGDLPRSSASISNPSPAARRHAFGRPAAARRHRPRPDAGAEGPARRRADCLARSAQCQIVMDALKSINENDGITVITNLHTSRYGAPIASASSAWQPARWCSTAVPRISISKLSRRSTAPMAPPLMNPLHPPASTRRSQRWLLRLKSSRWCCTASERRFPKSPARVKGTIRVDPSSAFCGLTGDEPC